MFRLRSILLSKYTFIYSFLQFIKKSYRRKCSSQPHAQIKRCEFCIEFHYKECIYKRGNFTTNLHKKYAQVAVGLAKLFKITFQNRCLTIAVRISAFLLCSTLKVEHLTFKHTAICCVQFFKRTLRVVFYDTRNSPCFLITEKQLSLPWYHCVMLLFKIKCNNNL